MKKKYFLLFLLYFPLFVSSQNAGFLEILSPDVNLSCGNTTDTFKVIARPDYSGGYYGMVSCYYQLNNNAIVQQDMLFLSGIDSSIFVPEISPVDGLNTLRVWTDLPGDTDASNDEVMIQFEYTVNNPSLPYAENAEGFPETLFPQGNLDCLEFYAIGVDDQPDLFSTFGIVDLTTYSNAPAATSGTNAFSPTTYVNFFSKLYLVTPDIDISTVGLAELSFDYHVYGRFQGPISVDIYHNGAWVEDVYTMTEEERQLEISDSWKKKTILLNGYSGVIKVRFAYLDIDWVGWYGGDYTNGQFTGIDNIEVKEAPACPTPKNMTLPFDEITKETANISWNAGNIETNWEVEYGPLGFTPGTGTVMQTSQASYTLTGLTTGTAYDVYVKAVCGATPGMNDSTAVHASFETVCSFVAPWTEDVESHTGTTRGRIENCWKTNAYNTHSYRWDIVSDGGGTPSNGTGPIQPYEGTHYFHIESSIIEGGNSFQIAPGVSTMYSPFIDVSGLTNPALKFYYYMYGSNIGSLNVDVFHNGSWTNDVHVVTGPQQTASSDPWGSSLVDLSAFSGEIRLRFTGKSGVSSPFDSDTAIDLIQINEFQVLATPEVTSDLGIVMYPNPVEDIIHIQSTQNIQTIKIFSIQGKLLLAISAVANKEIKIPASNFETGIYFVEITNNQKKQVIKMLKN
ncbi:MAM domain, meprin/A5/mu [Kordia sp. SMS9]|uniref:T9SS type A sorting domain-containing protein n=1 Tax=Kordia sp. SMS9 TaxID=2282170 RepID=UPI000E0D8CE5|nr:T9SS type A sorting domain-containing protein [Kordia sp. SMS9]AXG70146.1 MAM domain, meprin/A5/mu [Kordia sp. SMS9]